jgi:hypothetical protein
MSSIAAKMIQPIQLLARAGGAPASDGVGTSARPGSRWVRVVL